MKHSGGLVEVTAEGARRLQHSHRTPVLPPESGVSLLRKTHINTLSPSFQSLCVSILKEHMNPLCLRQWDGQHAADIFC